MKFKTVLASLVLLAAWQLLTGSRREPSNPPTARTGAPGETTCSTEPNCHAGGLYTGIVEISGVPDTVTGGTTYPITLTNTSTGPKKSGFELTCLDDANKKCGTLTAGTGVSIASNNTLQRSYARQSAEKSFVNGTVSWTFNWKAPTTIAAGNGITFYFASLCGDGNGKESGDNALASNKKVVLKTTVGTSNVAAEPSFELFPNPVLQDLNLVFSGNETGQLTIFNVAGRVVFQEKVAGKGRFNLRELPGGVYLARIEAGGKMATRQVVKP